MHWKRILIQAFLKAKKFNDVFTLLARLHFQSRDLCHFEHSHGEHSFNPGSYINMVYSYPNSSGGAKSRESIWPCRRNSWVFTWRILPSSLLPILDPTNEMRMQWCLNIANINLVKNNFDLCERRNCPSNFSSTRSVLSTYDLNNMNPKLPLSARWL